MKSRWKSKATARSFVRGGLRMTNQNEEWQRDFSGEPPSSRRGKCSQIPRFAQDDMGATRETQDDKSRASVGRKASEAAIQDVDILWVLRPRRTQDDSIEAG